MSSQNGDNCWEGVGVVLSCGPIWTLVIVHWLWWAGLGLCLAQGVAGQALNVGKAIIANQLRVTLVTGEEWDQKCITGRSDAHCGGGCWGVKSRD